MRGFLTFQIKGKIKGISLGQLPEIVRLLCARCEPGFAYVALFQGRPVH